MTYLAVAAAVAAGPSTWRWVPLRRIARLRRKTNSDSRAQLLALSANRGIEPRPEDGGRQLPSNETVEGYWIVYANDLVFNPMWALEGGVGVSTLSGAVSTAYRVYELAPAVEPRFLHYWLRSSLALEQYRLLVRGITTFDRSVTREDLEDMPVPLPDRAQQRAIADYLDDETARINALIAAKHRMIDVVNERDRSLIDADIAAAANRWGTTPLKRLAKEITVGIVVTPAAWYADSGVPALRGTNVKRGHIDLTDLVYLTPEGDRLHPKSRLSAGDLVTIRTGQAGATAIVPEDMAGSNCIDVLITRLNPAIDTRFVEFMLNSTWANGQIEEGSAGALQQHLNVGAMGELLIPAVPAGAQKELSDTWASYREHRASLTSTLERQLDLLGERCQAQIAAGVTGTLALPGVAVV